MEGGTEVEEGGTEEEESGRIQVNIYVMSTLWRMNCCRQANESICGIDSQQ